MASALPKILVVEKLSTWALERLHEIGQVTEIHETDEASLLRSIPSADALIVRTYAQVTDRVIQAGVRLKVIGRAGIGVENIDTQAARARGVVVIHTPAASTEAVAELTIGMMIALVRRMGWSEQQLRQGEFFNARAALQQPELSELTLGIIGMGRIGQRVAEIARQAWKMNILYNDIRDVRPLSVVAESRNLPELLQQADVLSLHVPLTRLTHGMINAEQLQLLKATSWLINTARGAVMQTDALVAALLEGRLAGAALDVTEPEPLPVDHPLLSAPNCLLTPHIGSRTTRSQLAMNRVVEDVIAVLQGSAPQYPYMALHD
ncbi:MAG: Hydroxypyruvate reductase [Phycisphaerae bacterium]|nr:Hydroxypyruvate reductase [Phycisphaerae bacterium]